MDDKLTRFPLASGWLPAFIYQWTVMLLWFLSRNVIPEIVALDFSQFNPLNTIKTGHCPADGSLGRQKRRREE